MAVTGEIRLPELLDGEMGVRGRLHPTALSLEERLAPLSSARMELLPEEGPEPGQLVRLYPPEDSAGIYRVTRTRRRPDRVEVSLEHGLALLGDRVLPGYTELGGGGMTVEQVLQRLLAEQTGDGPRWQLGEAPQEAALAWSFENENLLTALLTVGAACAGTMWRLDQSGLPWRISLVPCPEEPECRVRPGRSLQEAAVTLDRSSLVTRLWPLGYGEGEDQLHIGSVNDGKRYLDADTADTWGLVEAVWTDSSITDAATLKAEAQRVLESRCRPQVSVTVTAAELSSLTGAPADHFTLGSVCRLTLPGSGGVLDERIIAISRPDMKNQPLKAVLTLANAGTTVLDRIAGLSRDSSVIRRCSQGAAQEYAVHHSENCDAAHPAVVEFYIDRDAIHVNRVLLNFTAKAYRVYETFQESGSCSAKYTVSGGTVSGFTSGSLDEEGNPLTVTEASGLTKTDSANGLTGSHSHTLTEHNHGMEHVHSLSLTVGSASGTVTVPDHRHTMAWGITEAAAPGKILVHVDGTQVTEEYGPRHSELDITALLERDEEGKIKRGAWHRVWLTPDTLAYVTADIHVRSFIRSRNVGTET